MKRIALMVLRLFYAAPFGFTKFASMEKMIIFRSIPGKKDTGCSSR